MAKHNYMFTWCPVCRKVRECRILDYEFDDCTRHAERIRCIKCNKILLKAENTLEYIEVI